MYGATSYSASKFALEGFSDGIRREFAQWNIKVVLVEPGKDCVQIEVGVSSCSAAAMKHSITEDVFLPT